MKNIPENRKNQIEKIDGFGSDIREEYLECNIGRSDQFYFQNVSRRNILGVIQYTTDDNLQSSLFGNKDVQYPFVKVPMSNLSLPYDLEIWYGNGEIKFGKQEDLIFACNSHYLFGCISLALGFKTPVEVTFDAYTAIINCMKNTGFPYLARIWHFIPRINETRDQNHENYKLFSLGRGYAFEEYKKYSKSIDYPASTAVGIDDNSMHFYFLASRRNKPFPFENPLQVSAYHYPVQSGLMPPLFSRAVILGNGHEYKLFISGTASISGHESIYSDNIENQFETTIDNINAVVSSNAIRSFNGNLKLSLRDLSFLKIYLRKRHHLDMITQLIEKRGICCPRMVLQADICRSELLLEIEGILCCDVNREKNRTSAG